MQYLDRPAMLGARFLDVSGCACEREKIGRKPITNLASYNIQMIDGLPGKAQIFPGTGQIQIDRAFWARTTDAQKAAVLAHELAHDEDPLACEGCADARAGARLRWQGWPAEVAVNALAGVVRSRQAGGAVLEGWQIADATIKERATYTGGIRSGEDLAPLPPNARKYATPRNLERSDGSVDNQIAGVVSPSRLRFRLPRALDAGSGPRFADDDGQSIEVDDGQSIGFPEGLGPAPLGPAPVLGQRPPTPPPSSSGGAVAIVAGLLILAAVLLKKR